MQQLSCHVEDETAFVFQEIAKNSKRSISNLLGLLVEAAVSKATPELKLNAKAEHQRQVEAAFGLDVTDLESAPWSGGSDGGR
jgi:hypothetical protein